MTIDKGGDQPTIEIIRKPTGVAGIGIEEAHAFISIPIAFDVQSIFIQSAASIAVGIIIWVIILKCFESFNHVISCVIVTGLVLMG